jgi:hypothetical protein
MLTFHKNVLIYSFLQDLLALEDEGSMFFWHFYIILPCKAVPIPDKAGNVRVT